MLKKSISVDGMLKMKKLKLKNGLYLKRGFGKNPKTAYDKSFNDLYHLIHIKEEMVKNKRVFSKWNVIISWVGNYFEKQMKKLKVGEIIELQNFLNGG